MEKIPIAKFQWATGNGRLVSLGTLSISSSGLQHLMYRHTADGHHGWDFMVSEVFYFEYPLLGEINLTYKIIIQNLGRI